MTPAVGLEAFAPAKINLFLHVLARRSDGLHLLDSLVVFADTGDRLRLEPGPRLHLEVSGPFASRLSDEDNLVLQAARLAAQARPGALTGRFHLEKHLPVAAGIGGGSSDAAAAIRLLRHCNEGLDAAQAEEIAAALGSDVPACLAAQAVWLEGAGETVSPAGGLPQLDAVLVNPGVAVPTGKVFALWDDAHAQEHDQAAMARPENLHEKTDLLRFLSLTRNDLEAAACRIAPAVSDALDALAEIKGCMLARMSGSGATVFGLFDDAAAAKDAAVRLEKAHPGWWVAATRLNAPAEYRNPPPQAAPPDARSGP